jgi:hypothetical protein
MKQLILGLSLISSQLFAHGFVSGTKVFTLSDSRDICEVGICEMVLTCDENYGYREGEVNKGYTALEETLSITLANKTTVECSKRQHFLLQNGDWVAAKKLKIGDQLAIINGYSDIIEIEETGENEVYTFEVTPNHTYFANGVIVHNPYGLGKGPYGQSQTAKNNGKPTGVPNHPNADKAACFAKTAALGCTLGVVGSVGRGNITPAGLGTSCTGTAASTTAGAAISGGCSGGKGGGGGCSIM